MLIILAQDGTAIKPAVASAISQGIPVIAYDRLIEDPKALYITFDNVEVGRMQGRAIFAAVPRGNYIIIKGNKADANADFLRGGIDEIIKDAVAKGDIKIVGETYTDNWDPSKAQTETEQFLTQAENKVDAVVPENDGMAGGVVSALAAQGLAGKVPVSGQDGDTAALNRVAAGTQTVDVWKDARQLGKAAGEAAVQLCNGTTIDKVPGAKPFTTPGNNNLSSVLLTPIPITKDNLNIVLDAGWITKAALCQGVPAVQDAVLPIAAARRHDAGQRRVLPPTRSPRGAATPERSARSLLRLMELDTRLLGMVVALAIIWFGFQIASGGLFLTSRNLWNLSVQSASIAIMATGMVLIIVSRNIDLSVGSLLGFLGYTMAMVQVQWIPNALTSASISPTPGSSHWPSAWPCGAADRRVPGQHHRLRRRPVVHRHAGWISRLARADFSICPGPDPCAAWTGPLPCSAAARRARWARRAAGSSASWRVSAIIYSTLSNRRRRRAYGFPVRPIWALVTVLVVGCAAVLGAVWIANSYFWPDALAHDIRRGAQHSGAGRRTQDSGRHRQSGADHHRRRRSR